MTPPEYAFDPGAELRTFSARLGDGAELVEAHLERSDDGLLCFTIVAEDGRCVSMTHLRADFLEPFLAQARAREENAA